MRIAILAGLVASSFAAGVDAQQAVQWKVSDGGNGHWYRVISVDAICWEQALVDAEAIGGHLATLTTIGEDAWLRSQLPELPWYFIGGRQDPNACEPSCGWYWITGEPFLPLWDASQPDGDLPWTVPQDILTTYRRGWHDGPDCGDQANCGGGCPLGGYVVEWSADCNNDGIVDYGQCRDGSLPDYNGNNIPDCCEQGTPCVVGNYPVQWRASEGGNGHWYQLTSEARFWDAQSQFANGLSGYLATITSAGENAFVYALLPSVDPYAFFIGGKRQSGTWSWVTGETWSYTNWDLGEPNGVGDQITWIHGPAGPRPATWNDHPASDFMFLAVLEFDADCNGDGIVDKGQILRGQFADLNTDGVPDICQPPTCVDADIFRDFNVNGGDLGILLSQWGPNTPLTRSDLNRDGAVDGADLGIFLSFWGPCP